MNERQSEIEMLRLCPVDEETLNDLAEDFILLLKTWKVLSKSDREMGKAIMKLGCRIIKLGNCVGISQLSGINSVEALYSNDSFRFTPDNCLDLADCIIVGKQLMISSINITLKNCLLKQVLQNIFTYSVSPDAALFLCSLWTLRDQMCLSTETIEVLVNGYPKCLEIYLMDVVDIIISSEDESNMFNDDIISFCKLCSESAMLFQVAMTILHELLLLSDIHKMVLKFITSFIYHVQLQCKNCSFIDLFPERLHMLVTLLKIKPVLYPDSFVDSDFNLNSVLKNLSDLICRDQRAGVALLSYYPDWIPFLSNYCSKNNIFKMGPDFQITSGESDILFLKFLVLSII